MVKKKTDGPTKVNFENSIPVAEHDLHGISLQVTQDELMAQIESLEKQHAARRKSEEEKRANMLLDKIEKERAQEAEQQPQSRNRESVEFQGREFSQREMLERKFYQCNNLGKLFIDPNEVPADEIWYWAAKELKGKDNTRHINNLLFKEWQFVSPGEAPNACRINEYAQEHGHTQSNFITNEASILMKRKNWIHDIEMGILMKKQHEVESGVVAATNQMSDEQIINPHAPKSKIFENHRFLSENPY